LPFDSPIYTLACPYYTLLLEGGYFGHSRHHGIRGNCAHIHDAHVRPRTPAPWFCACVFSRVPFVERVRLPVRSLAVRSCGTGLDRRGCQTVSGSQNAAVGEVRLEQPPLCRAGRFACFGTTGRGEPRALLTRYLGRFGEAICELDAGLGTRDGNPRLPLQLDPHQYRHLMAIGYFAILQS
jgi:hypothetical protein